MPSRGKRKRDGVLVKREGRGRGRREGLFDEVTRRASYVDRVFCSCFFLQSCAVILSWWVGVCKGQTRERAGMRLSWGKEEGSGRAWGHCVYVRTIALSPHYDSDITVAVHVVVWPFGSCPIGPGFSFSMKRGPTYAVTNGTSLTAPSEQYKA